MYYLMVEKAKTKKNGVYSMKGNCYLVFNNQLKGFADYFGNVYEVVCGFGVDKGKSKDRFEARDVLKGYLKQYDKKTN